ncbi:MAG: arylesterase [Gemmatimonadaceae bacterium]
MRAVVWVVGVCVSAVACGRSKSDTAHAGSRPAERAPAAASGSASAATTADRGAPTILFVGTSLTAGLGLNPDSAYPMLIQQRIDSLGERYQVVNAGVSGETSAGALRRIGWLMRGRVDVFVLETGANDALRALDVDSLRANMQGVLDSVLAHHPRAQVVIAGMMAPPNLGSAYTTAFARVYPEIARANHAALIPFLLRGVAGVDTLNQADGIHPNARGERIVADNVWRVLGPLLERFARPAVAVH